MNRAERRARTAVIIKRRVSRQRTFGNPLDEPHTMAKHDTLGRCSNRGCWLCAVQREEKRQRKKQERTEGKKPDSERGGS